MYCLFMSLYLIYRVFFYIYCFHTKSQLYLVVFYKIYKLLQEYTKELFYIEYLY